VRFISGLPNPSPKIIAEDGNCNIFRNNRKHSIFHVTYSPKPKLYIKPQARNLNHNFLTWSIFCLGILFALSSLSIYFPFILKIAYFDITSYIRLYQIFLVGMFE
jgi:hypothetical protein